MKPTVYLNRKQLGFLAKIEAALFNFDSYMRVSKAVEIENIHFEFTEKSPRYKRKEAWKKIFKS